MDREERRGGQGCSVKEFVAEVVSGQLGFEMHAEDFLMNVMSQEAPQGRLNLIQVSARNFLAKLCNCFTAG